MAFSYMPKLFGELREILFDGHFITPPGTRHDATVALGNLRTGVHRAALDSATTVDPFFQSV
jgi:hypothetical protein